MRNGFTMIELIFVIVIIGILAAIAIPKLAATRDDAQIASEIANAKTCVIDACSYYISRKNVDLTKWDTNGTKKSAACTAATDTSTKYVKTTIAKDSVTITSEGNISLPKTLTKKHECGGTNIEFGGK